jgi:aminoglycoside 3-N-acetyltransferase
METLSLQNFVPKYKVTLVDFPFFYSDIYALSLAKTEDKKTLLFCDTEGNSLICKVWKNKFIEIAQPMYPPLNTNGARLSFDAEKEFLSTLVHFMRTKKIAQRLTQPENFAIFQCCPEEAVSAPFGTFVLHLENKTEEELFENLHPKNKNKIRKAEKSNVSIKYGNEVLNDFYAIYKQTMLRSNMYCQEFSYFEDYFHTMPENIICAVSYYNNEPQGGVFIPFTKFGAFYLYGASAEKITLNGAINYLHWNCIKILREKGVKRYDFVGARLSDVTGTKLEGIQLFKERFGAKLEKGILWKLNVNKFDCLVFDMLILAKHKLSGLTPPLDIIDEENAKTILKVNQQHYSLNKKIRKKISAERQQLRKSFRALKKITTERSLLLDLQHSGIAAGDTILVHSSLSKIGNVIRGGKTVIDTLIAHIGPEGNIAMPSYSYVDSMEKTSRTPEYVFDPLTSPSIVGKITEEFRKLPGVERSVHPTHSICVFGPKSTFITEGHLAAKTNFGKDTPFHRIRELNGKIVGLGINLGPVTIYHTVEDFYPELFKDVYLTEQSTINVLVHGKILGKNISIHNPAFHTTRIDKNKHIEHWLHRHFIEKGLLHESKFGAGVLWWMNIQDLFTELISLRKQNITIYKVPEE